MLTNRCRPLMFRIPYSTTSTEESMYNRAKTEIVFSLNVEEHHVCIGTVFRKQNSTMYFWILQEVGYKRRAAIAIQIDYDNM